MQKIFDLCLSEFHEEVNKNSKYGAPNETFFASLIKRLKGIMYLVKIVMQHNCKLHNYKASTHNLVY